MLKIKSIEELENIAGIAMPENYRDMSAYNGKEFKCICGDIHYFEEMLNDRNYVASGVNAKMMVHCPNNYNSKTIITTKYRFIVIFNGFESIAGYKQ